MKLNSDANYTMPSLKDLIAKMDSITETTVNEDLKLPKIGITNPNAKIAADKEYRLSEVERRLARLENKVKSLIGR